MKKGMSPTREDRIEIMDTTLRDGEQTCGVSFLPHEKISAAKMLLEVLHVNRVEVASARVSDGEFECVKKVCDWARETDNLCHIEVLGFVDDGKSIDWIRRAGGKIINLLCKGSEKHCRYQLGKTPHEHWEDIRRNVLMAYDAGLHVNLYLEDWSNGIKDNPDYVIGMVEYLSDLAQSEGETHDAEDMRQERPAQGPLILRFMLPDTLGILNPSETSHYVGLMTQTFPSFHFDFHAHNDYDLAVSNAFAAVEAGAKGLHTTINGLGERAGNAPLASIQAVLKDHLGCETDIDEEKLGSVSRIIESYSGIAIPPNRPIVGENVFTQVAGVHADGDNKNNLYCNNLLPERFGRKREYALGKTSGKANIRRNLDELGLELDDDAMRRVTDRIIELGDKKEVVTQEDLPYIIADVLKHSVEEEKVTLIGYNVALSKGLKPTCALKIDISGQTYEENSSGDGQYDAFVRALRKIYKETLKRRFPMLINYAVSIPPGGRTDAFVQTIITWEHEGHVFKTRGFDADQTEAAIKATMKMLNILENSTSPVTTGNNNDN